MKALERQIAEGRSDHQEFVASPDDFPAILSHIAALLNSGGGMVVVGADEIGHPLGLINGNARAKDIAETLRKTISPTPLLDAQVETVPGGEVIVIDVPGARQTPYVAEGRVYLRKGKRTVMATGEDLQELFERRSAETLTWERRPSPVLEIDDLDDEEFERIVRIAAQERRFSFRSPHTPETVLEDLGMRTSGQITQAGDICFGKFPALRHPQARLRAFAFRSTRTGDDYIDEEDISAPIAQVVKRGVNFVFRNSPLAAQFLPSSLERKNSTAYPEFAVREGLVNALAHRDYAHLSGGATLLVFPDRLEIWNSGKLPKGWKVDKLRQTHRSLPQNPDIAQFLYAAKLMERIGRGTLRMIEACREARLPTPAWKVDEDGVTLTLFSRASTGSPVAKLTQRQLELIHSMEPGQTIRSGEYAKRFAAEVSARQAQRDLRELQEADLLRLEGKGRAAHYIRTERSLPE